jgi:hypothetical protein
MNKKYLIVALMFFAILVSCEDDLPTVEVPPDPPQITVDSAWQFSVKIDGTIFTARDSTNDYIGSYSTSGLIAAFPDTSALIYESGLSDSLITNSLFISKGTLRFASGMIPVDSIFEPFFAPASYQYSPNSADGIVIEWYDSNGELWSTEIGTANQSGSSFVIVANLSSHVNGYLDVKLKATFNCKLYNASGQSKTLTEGLYVGSFEAI